MGVFFEARRYLTLVTLSLCFAACSSSNTGVVASSTGGGTSLDAANPGPYTIVIKQFAYVPASLDIPAGETLWIVNRDVEQHSVTSESKVGDFVAGAVNGVQFDSGMVNPDATGSLKLSASAPAGTVIPYFCTVHKSTMGEGHLTIL